MTVSSQHGSRIAEAAGPLKKMYSALVGGKARPDLELSDAKSSQG